MEIIKRSGLELVGLSERISRSRATTIGFLLLLHALFLAGFGVFLKGFFLIRSENSNKSSPLSSITSLAATGSDFPVRRPPDRIFLFVIDGLRLDYMRNMPRDGGDCRLVHNRLSIISKLAQAEPRNSLFYGVISDPPTVTSTRLKAITTGGIPSFMEVFNNLDCSQLQEDNWIHQLTHRHPPPNESSFILAGDDTWAKLFPSVFDNNIYSRPLESFDTHDIYTLDNGVEDFFGFNEIVDSSKITSNNSRSSNSSSKRGNKHFNISSGAWNLIIAHFLGVDHAGHSFDAFHPVLAERLDRMNVLIEETVNQLPENTLLMVMGDHGMTDDGNHGGASKEEVETGVFIYLKRNKHPPAALNSLDDGVCACRGSISCDDNDANQKIAYWNKSLGHFECMSQVEILENPRMIAQIDLVPSISSILNLPIPFSNVGGIIPELMLLFDIHDDENGHVSKNTREFSSLSYLAHVLQLNIGQIHRYYESYFGKEKKNEEGNGEGDVSQDPRLKILKSYLPDFDVICQNITQLEAKIKQSFIFLDLSVKLAKDLWMTYDVPSMVVGIIIMVSASLIGSMAFNKYFSSIYCKNKSVNCVADVNRSNRAVSILSTLLLFATLGVSLLHLVGPFSDNLINYEDAIQSFGAMAIVILVILSKFFGNYARNSRNANGVGEWKVSESKLFLADFLLYLTLVVQIYTCIVWRRDKSSSSEFRDISCKILLSLLICQASIVFLAKTPESGFIAPAMSRDVGSLVSFIVVAALFILFASRLLMPNSRYQFFNKLIIFASIFGVVFELLCIIITMGWTRPVEWPRVLYFVSLFIVCVESTQVTIVQVSVVSNFIFTSCFFLDIFDSYYGYSGNGKEDSSLHGCRGEELVRFIASFHLYLIIFIRFTFFVTGHSLQLSDVPIATGPLVLGEFHILLAPFVVLYNCLAPELLHFLILELILSVRSANLESLPRKDLADDNYNRSRRKQSLFYSQIKKSTLFCNSIYRLLILFCCSFSCFWLRRHLMIMSIFTPKLIVETACYLFSLITLFYFLLVDQHTAI